MTHKKLGNWTLASGNTVEVVITIGAGDVPKVLSVRAEWAWHPSPGDIAEYRQKVQPAIAGLLVPLVGCRVVIMSLGEGA